MYERGYCTGLADTFAPITAPRHVLGGGGKRGVASHPSLVQQSGVGSGSGSPPAAWRFGHKTKIDGWADCWA